MSSSTLRNLPTEQAEALSGLITDRKNQVVSMALSQRPGIQMTLLAFSAGEDVSEEQYFGDTFYYVVQGNAVIRFSGQDIPVMEGEVLMVPADTLHALVGNGAFKILQITLDK